MFYSTRLHHDTLPLNPERYTIRVGASVPPNSVNLAYFHNNYAKLADHLLISEAPKQTIEHTQAQQIIEKTGLASDSDKWFEQYVLFQNEQGYMGYLTRQTIQWDLVQSKHEKVVQHQLTCETETEDVDDVYYYQDHQYKGHLTLQSSSYIPTRYQEKIETSTSYRQEKRGLYQKNLTTPSFNWPIQYTTETGETHLNVEGYEGSLSKNGEPKYYKQSTSVPGEAVSIRKVVLNAKELPQTFVEGGIEYNLITVEESVEKIPYFGVVRWSGSFITSKDKNGLYGDPHPRTSQYYQENVYVRNISGTDIYGRGHFTESNPKIPEYIWNAVQFSTYATDVTDFSLKMPNKNNLTYDKKVDDRVWMMDTTYSPTGVVWADEWCQDHSFPPTGYEALGSPTIELNTSDTPHFNKLNAGPFNNAEQLTAYYGPTTSGNRIGMNGTDLWFRDAIVFYKTQANVFKGYYVGHKPTTTVHTWHGEQQYVGLLEKTTTTVQSIPTAYLCEAHYQGKVSRDIQTYTGTAYYSGIITKQDGLSASPSQLTRTFEMYPNEENILETLTGQNELESRRFLITNHYKALEPLYYVYRLKYPVVMNVAQSEFKYYKGKNIQLLDSQLKALQSRFKYSIELKRVEDNDVELYWVYIYTNFITTSKNIVKCMYNAYDLQSKGVERIRTGYVEQLNTQPMYVANRHFKINEILNEPKSYQIKVEDPRILEDSRNKLPFSYVVYTTDGSYESIPIPSEALNSQYAFYREQELFNGRQYKVSPIRQSRYLTAQDILVQFAKDLVPTLEDLADKTISVRFDTEDVLTQQHLSKMSLYTNSDGSDYIWVETTEPTGFYNEETGHYDRAIELEGVYHVSGNQIKMAYQVVCLDTQSIKTLEPLATETLSCWFPRIQYGRFSHVADLNGVTTKLTYALPEFDDQLYSSNYGRPYQEMTGEVAKIIDENTIQVQYAPMFVELDDHHEATNLKVYKIGVNNVKQEYVINHWSYTEGYITLENRISENDKIYVDYVYEEETYTYRGYRDEQGLVHLDLNPNQYHTFTDYTDANRVERPVYELFNSIVYFFIKPMLLQPYSFDGQPVPNRYTYNEQVIYHQIDNKIPATPETDLLIGSVYVRHNTSLGSTTLMDTRQFGGGIIETMSDQLRMELEPSSQHYFDIGYWDGEPFSENAVIVVRLDKMLLEEHGGRFKQAQIEEIVSKWTAFGVFPIIEYVTSLDDINLPQAHLNVLVTKSEV